MERWKKSGGHQLIQRSVQITNAQHHHPNERLWNTYRCVTETEVESQPHAIIDERSSNPATTEEENAEKCEQSVVDNFEQSKVQQSVVLFGTIKMMKSSVPGRLLEMFIEPYDHDKATTLMWDFLSYSLTVSMLYVLVLFSLQRFMRDREAFTLKWPLVFWNAGLTVFSALGSYYATVDILTMAEEHSSLTATYCYVGSALTGPNGFWGFLFTMSKMVEFGDTIFIVLRKKPLTFLHWYHHIVTLNFTVIGYAGNNAFTVWLLWMNYIAHSGLYLYYTLSALDIKPPRLVTTLIVLLQISQFGISLLMFYHLAFLKLEAIAGWTTERQCDFQLYALVAAVFMEISYIVLFAQYFQKVHLMKTRNQQSAVQKKGR
uniref:Elongation of very long chain fatty acids protein n=1 Tax=Steinernema glaseri TaxID=37863 RepID=A0A1I7YCI1_9BILA